MIINGAEVKRIFRNGSTIKKIFRNGIEVYTPPLIPIARYSAKGKTNQDADRTILKDLEGNGHDIVLRNFGYAGMSGFGGYNGVLTPSTKQNPSLNYTTLISNKIEVVGIKNAITITDTANTNSNFFQSPYLTMSTTGKIKVTIECQYPIELFIASEGSGTGISYTTFRNGTTEVEHITKNRFLYGRFSKIPNGVDIYPATDSFKLTIEIPNDYPDCLVSDGIDDCGICSNLNVGKDYTVILKREFINRESQSYPTVLSKRHGGVSDGEFAIDGSNIALGTLATSYGLGTAVTQYNQMSVSVQTKKQYWSSVDYVKYNLQVGTATPNNTLVLCAGILQINGQCNYYFKGAISDLIIYDRTLTEEEALSEINKYGLIHESPHILTEMGGGMATENNNLIILE